LRLIGAKTELIQIIHKILKISDQITFQTHKSYFFFAIAVTVAAISGKLVQAAIIVAQIAHSDNQKYFAIKTADETTCSDDITRRARLTNNKTTL